MDRTLDEVVLVDQAGRRLGSHQRSTIHTANTPLHLAFSCWIFDPAGRVLITRRALGKLAFPGVWSNSCCGHPRPDEDVGDAVRRRIDEELDLTVTTLDCVLPDFSYSAADTRGIVENELCPVYVAVAEDPTSLDPDPAEVADWVWQQPESLATAVLAAPYAYSPWAVLQLPLLTRCDHPSTRPFGG
ncbi:isopentenyl-diphosphate Delta-isomerase [Microlunatus elymi]|uniref:Isopentenyl-diphosphate Delta-isomerase n=1 Tax=Microlunatus elymi TaxID=2596828 RepID=A0A516PW61_9ACTN|nr:isopentenyl-diphosphate Delta-isomerase [Microlunatus elymi]QDP95426.1 isopentenyl-diphosphate Delta-isomerase [Microlunatus elymi]